MTLPADCGDGGVRGLRADSRSVSCTSFLAWLLCDPQRMPSLSTAQWRAASSSSTSFRSPLLLSPGLQRSFLAQFILSHLGDVAPSAAFLEQSPQQLLALLQDLGKPSALQRWNGEVGGPGGGMMAAGLKRRFLGMLRYRDLMVLLDSLARSVTKLDLSQCLCFLSRWTNQQAKRQNITGFEEKRGSSCTELARIQLALLQKC